MYMCIRGMESLLTSRSGIGLRAVLLVYIIIVFFVRLGTANVNRTTDEYFDENLEDYPSSIPLIHTRKDHYTGEPVSRGRLQLLGGPLNENNKKVTYQEFHRILQCPVAEPGLDGNRGSLSLLRSLPPSRETVEIICAWAETRCDRWKNCDILMKAMKEGKHHTGLNHVVGSPHQARLMRIMNGKLYYDWPWGLDRFTKVIEAKYFFHMNMVLQKISNIGDSVFLRGEEMPYMPFNIPFPALSESPSFKNMDIPEPWKESFFDEYKLYKAAFLTDLGNQSESVYNRHHSKDGKDWEKRISKAVFCGTLSTMRNFVFDAASLRPDLFDAMWTVAYHNQYFGWNPLSREEPMKDGKSQPTQESFSEDIGTVHLLSKYKIENTVDYIGKHYKYVIVLVGLDGLALSGRFANLLAHSGAVVLLQTTEFEYHFQSRLRPWVHYVPISYNNADIIRKVAWLKRHDHAAYRIAQNGKTFGESFLRLEDYFCYFGTLLHAFGRLYRGSNATVPFNATILDIPSAVVGIP